MINQKDHGRCVWIAKENHLIYSKNNILQCTKNGVLELEELPSDKYFVFLKPVDPESEEILKEKIYKTTKSVAQMWIESVRK